MVDDQNTPHPVVEHNTSNRIRQGSMVERTPGVHQEQQTK